VTVGVAVAPGRAVDGPTAAPPATAGAATAHARLRVLRVGKRRGRWRAVVRASAPATLSGRLQHAGGSRALVARRVRAGVGRVGLGRLRRGRYRVRLYLDGRRAASVRFRAS